MAKRILVVCQHFWPESFRINDICDGLVEAGWEVDVLCGQPNYPKGEFFEGYSHRKPHYETHNGISIYRTFEIPRKHNTALRIFLNYMTFPYASCITARKLKKKRYDKVFIYSLSPVYMGKAGLKIAKKQKIEAVTYVMDLWPENLYSVIPVRSRILRNFLMKTSTRYYQRSDQLICLSQKAKEILQSRTQKPDEAFCVLPQSCEKLYEEKIEDSALKERFAGKFCVVFCGNISPAQDFPCMIEAAGILKEKGLPIHWIIVGDGMSKAQVQSEIEAKQLADCFTFEGFLPMAQIPHYTGIADALVACLVHSEAFDCNVPAKVPSYLAAQKPIVLAMDGEANRLINENHCGIAASAGDAKGLADAIERIYHATPSEREDMGKQCDQVYRQSFERERNFATLLDFLESKRERESE